MGINSESIKNGVRHVLRVVRAMRGREILTRRDVRISTRKYGYQEGEGGWVLSPSHVRQPGIVYSAGVGTDISFELELIKNFDLQIHTFDPTPRSNEWLRQQELPEQIRHHPVAIAGVDGNLELYPPPDPTHVSFSPLRRDGIQNQAVRVPARRLSSILRERGHERLDVLKMDIEGSEYDVISDIVQSGIVIDQFLVEFHHRQDGVPLSATRKAIQDLRRVGFRLFHVSPRGEEYSFIHSRCLE